MQRVRLPLPKQTTTLQTKTETDAAGNKTYTFADRMETSLTITSFSKTASDDAYASVYGDANANNITYVAETGELLLGKNVQNKLAALSINNEIRISYDKSEWKTDDLDPVHYFYTERYTDTRDADDPLIYNEEKLTAPKGNVAKQIIEYDIGSNQTIRVNTTADEIYTHNMGRDVGEVKALLEEYDSLEKAYDTVNSLIQCMIIGKGNEIESGPFHGIPYFCRRFKAGIAADSLRVCHKNCLLIYGCQICILKLIPDRVIKGIVQILCCHFSGSLLLLFCCEQT